MIKYVEKKDLDDMECAEILDKIRLDHSINKNMKQAY